IVRDLHPLLSDSSIRRLKRQRFISQRYRNQDTDLKRSMSVTRLALRGQHRLPIGLSLLKHPKSRFCEVTCDRDLSALVATSPFDPFVKPADMLVIRAFAIENRTIGGLNEGPFQIHIDIATYRTTIKLSSAGVLTSHQAAVARQLLGTVKPFNGA